jgi:LmbE family N-acetylglucosaminyl deacetylase
MKRLTKLLLRRFATAAKPYLQSHGLFLTSKVFNTTAIVWEPGAEKVVVLAPHMDDETIGCGGAIARHVRAGASVHVVFLTDGRAGSSELSTLSGAARRVKEIELMRVRKEEATAALRTLGVPNMVFLDVEDGTLESSMQASSLRLREILERIRPAIVYVPCFLEEHPDHRAASRLLLEATRGSTLEFQCLAYEVWTPLFPNCLVKIDDVKNIKMEALAHYRSQLRDADYLHTALSLNAYRSAGFVNGHGKFAEAFAAAPLDQYRALFNAYEAG